MANPFIPGWNPDSEKRARDAYLATPGVNLCSAAQAFAGDDKPEPRAFSLTGAINWFRNQGPAGTCYINAGAVAAEATTSAAVLAGAMFEEKQLSRAFGAYETRRRDGSLGSGDTGGSVTNVFRSINETGLPPESMRPYKPDWRYCDTKPDKALYDEAAKNRYTGYMPIPYRDRKARRRALLNGHAIGIGIWWPYGWDTNGDKFGRMKSIGSGTYGHALVETGWFDDWDGHDYVEITNSHGPIYPALPPELASLVVGYRPAPKSKGKTYSFWVREDIYQTVCGYGNCEVFAASGINGFTVKNPFANWGQLLA